MLIPPTDYRLGPNGQRALQWISCNHGYQEKEQKSMFCPKCKSEFVDGINECPECRVGLIEELPPDPKPPRPELSDYAEVLVNPSPGDVAILKLILDSKEINFFIEGENAQISFATPKLMVRTDQVETARELIKGLKLSCTGCP